MRQIQTNRGIITVANERLSKRLLKENGYKFSFTAEDYDGNYIGRVWNNAKSATEQIHKTIDNRNWYCVG